MVCCQHHCFQPWWECRSLEIDAIYKSQTLEFLRPVFIGATLCAWFEIVGIDPANERIEIKSWIENQDGDNVIEGRAVASLLRGLK